MYKVSIGVLWLTLSSVCIADIWTVDDDGKADSKKQIVLAADVPYSLFSQFAKCHVHVSGDYTFTNPVIALGVEGSSNADVDENKKLIPTEKKSPKKKFFCGQEPARSARNSAPQAKIFRYVCTPRASGYLSTKFRCQKCPKSTFSAAGRTIFGVFARPGTKSARNPLHLAP